MDEAPRMYPNLSDETQFRLNKINEIKHYFIAETRERETMSKILGKHIADFDCFDKTLIVLSATSGGVLMISFSSNIEAPVEIASASFSFAFSLTTGIVKKLVKTTINKKKKHNKIVMLTRSKLNSIETLIT